MRKLLIEIYTRRVGETDVGAAINQVVAKAAAPADTSPRMAGTSSP